MKKTFKADSIIISGECTVCRYKELPVNHYYSRQYSSDGVSVVYRTTRDLSKKYCIEWEKVFTFENGRVYVGEDTVMNHTWNLISIDDRLITSYLTIPELEGLDLKLAVLALNRRTSIYSDWPTSEYWKKMLIIELGKADKIDNVLYA